MKTTITQILCLGLLFVTLSGNAQTAVEYMNNFSSEYQKIQQDMWDYTRSVSHGKSARKVNKRRMELIQTSDNAILKTMSVKPFNGSSTFKDSVLAYFQLVNIVLKEDYGKVVDLEAIAEDSYDGMEAYLTAREMASDKLYEASEMIGREQKKFAEANNVTIVETSSALGMKMEIAGKVYDHYNEVYLIFFKSYKQEAYLLDAIARQDLSAIEQNREALIATSNEGLEKLKNVLAYKMDKTLIEATNRILTFYNSEATNETVIVSDYILKAENFKKVKDALDKKSEKSRTKEDIDSYNSAVNEMNAAVNKYNASNDKTNKERGKLIDGWNSTAESFTATHVPKGK